MDREDTIASLRLKEQEAVNSALQQLRKQYAEQMANMEQKVLDAQTMAQAAERSETSQRAAAELANVERSTAIKLQEEAMQARDTAEKRASIAEDDKKKLIHIIEIKDSEIELAIIDRAAHQKRSEQLQTQVNELQEMLQQQTEQYAELSQKMERLQQEMDIEQKRALHETTELSSHTQELMALRKALQQARAAATVQVGTLLKRCEDLQFAVDKRDLAIASLKKKLDHVQL